jgi:hypothetical protein
MGMQSKVPPYLIQEQQALEAEIREAFKGVSREGGVSWSETVVIDDYSARPDNKARVAARANDKDRNWIELAGNDQWDAGPGVGGWSFLDPIGFRYYLPAAMIRALHAGYAAFTSLTLDFVLDTGSSDPRMTLLDDAQRRCVAHFVRFMVARDTANGNDLDAETWQRVYDDHWKSAG